MKKRVLVACEESQEVCKAFRDKGFEAYSCDIIECSGGHPEWHIQDDVLKHLNENWDLIIAHPPCTYLCVSGNRWNNVERYGDEAKKRLLLREDAVDFFMIFTELECKHIAIENPIGIMSTRYKKPDQIIQPWQYGHPYTKSTCLWLKGLPLLIPTDIMIRPSEGWVNQSFTSDGRYGGFKAFNGSKQRSKTFPGIAKAMAEQWGEYILRR